MQGFRTRKNRQGTLCKVERVQFRCLVVGVVLVQRFLWFVVLCIMTVQDRGHGRGSQILGIVAEGMSVLKQPTLLGLLNHEGCGEFRFIKMKRMVVRRSKDIDGTTTEWIARQIELLLLLLLVVVIVNDGCNHVEEGGVLVKVGKGTIGW